MDRDLSAATARGIPVERGARGAALSGRIGNQPCVFVALPAGGARQSSMAMTSWTPPRSATISAAKPRGRVSCECARAHWVCEYLLDIVPNHMSASQHNPWWDDVLTHGPFSQFADFFDFRNPHGEPFLRAFVLARPALWRGAGGRRIRHRSRRKEVLASSTTRIAGRWRRHPGDCCWPEPRAPTVLS